MAALTTTHLPNLQLISRGKVRDIYAVPSEPTQLLFVATDRISAYDVILQNGIPDKGKILTELSIFWFSKLASIIPNHFVTASIQDMPLEVREYKDQLDGRAMLVQRAEIIPIEAIVRGYLSGSAYEEYRKSGTINGMVAPQGLVQSSKFREPIFTPSTKAEQGEHDENISHDKARTLVGDAVFNKIRDASLALYTTAAEYALAHEVILADTKFEFGLIPSSPNPSEKQLILVDEVLTPDSSRYWPLAEYKEGQGQPSFDKQYLRDWLKSSGFRKGLESGPEGREGEGWTIEKSVVEGTKKRYAEALALLTGKAISL
ncbi:phosphoribosylaminoimidazole-succinocarboxamide synthase [Flagelloscypha sp. PMI_526]|nr:phosphoribosylaminoimidazole-succinocarboxamide synthase [Flagelloscypha sp. PMI_526]